MDKGPSDDMVQITSLTYNISGEQFLWICLTETNLKRIYFITPQTGKEVN